jgi:Ankyrin repeats (many copies)
MYTRKAHATREAPSGLTALIRASLLGHLDVVQALIAKGANVNAKDDRGLTALMATTNAKIRAVLVEAGAIPWGNHPPVVVPLQALTHRVGPSDTSSSPIEIAPGRLGILRSSRVAASSSAARNSSSTGMLRWPRLAGFSPISNGPQITAPCARLSLDNRRYYKIGNALRI